MELRALLNTSLATLERLEQLQAEVPAAVNLKPTFPAGGEYQAVLLDRANQQAQAQNQAQAQGPQGPQA